ncbi:uncharacterized protein N7473_012206 [Penicillium subrubescens]|nr:uncharacterized protein N7473_012206 [Penicillium subrubescens]KAJ5881153.1 hypothetical protein N7473_012206 [Penicillium subrubescens]
MSSSIPKNPHFQTTVTTRVVPIQPLLAFPVFVTSLRLPDVSPGLDD